AERLHVGDRGVSLALDDDRMYLSEPRTGVGCYRPLGDLPVPVEVTVAQLVDSNGHAIEVKVGELPVARGAEPDAATRAEREHVDHLRVVGVIDRVRECSASHDGIDHPL